MTSMNQTRKHYIMEQFEKKKFKRGYTNWNIFKNKYDNSKKKYTKYRKLMCNRTWLSFDEMGRITYRMIGGTNAKRLVLMSCFSFLV